MKRFSIRLGFIILGFNALVLLVGAVFFSLENVLCTSVSIYVNLSIINLVVTGLSKRKAVYIISPHWEKITHEIHEKIQRGVSFYNVRGDTRARSTKFCTR